VKTVRVFIAHSKSDDDELLSRVHVRVLSILQNAARSQGKVVTVECVLGRDDFADNFKRAGSWEAWAQDIIDRIDYVTRELVYGAIIVTNRFIGKATAGIADRALAAHRPILLFDDDGLLRPIREIRQVSASDPRTGWEVIAS